MSIDAVTETPVIGDDFAELNEWLVKQGLWDGRKVTWEQGPEIVFEVTRNILRHLFSLEEGSPEFEQFAARLAYIGGDAELRASLEPLLYPKAMFKSRGFIKDFWRKYKVEILVAAAVIAVVTAAVILAPATAATALATSAAVAVPVMNEREPRKSPSHASPSLSSPLKSEEDLAELPSPPLPSKSTDIEFHPHGTFVGGSFVTYEDLAKRSNLEKLFPTLPPSFAPSPPPPAWPSELASHARAQLGSPSPRLQSPPPTLGLSRNFSLPAAHPSPHKIGGINGMGNSVFEAQSNMAYVHSFAPETAIDWVYNASNTSVVDVAEAFFLNYNGLSPNTGQYLRENILAFHEQHKDNPGIKYFQICHSKGAIDVYNTLESLPEEARQRVIVFAIAPAKVVPRALCYRSYNYASTKDIVPLFETAHAGFLSSEENLEGYQTALENHGELMLLEPHEEATGIDHEFQSPTFRKRMDDHITDYLNTNGNYR
jgi:hypothetical protein